MAEPRVPSSAVRADRLRRLGRCRLYVCVAPRPDLAAFVAGVSSRGVGAVQFRDKDAEWTGQVAGLAAVRAAAAAGTLVAANDRADLAAAAGADVLHVGQDDIPPALARAYVGPDMLIGRSCHDEEQVLAAVADPDVDYFCAGPTWPTPTKPGRPAPGLSLTHFAAAHAGGKPWFAIGGIDEDNLDEVLAAGATRVVVVRALATAADPAAAAGRLASRLPGLARVAG